MKRFFLSFILLFGSQAFAAKDACTRALTSAHFSTFQNKSLVTWNFITGRDAEKIGEALSGGNTDQILAGVNGHLPAFEIEKILNGEKSLLSLGEGGSDFIFRILEVQEIQGLSLTAYAVDMIYTDRELFNDALPFPDLEALEQRIAQYPRHYVGGYHQSFKILNPDGKRMLFDEIVSTYSLNFILGTKGRQKTKDKALLKNILRHLKPHGVLRVWPNKNRYSKYLRPILDELMREGGISNHNLSSEEFTPSEYLIIQK